MPALASLAFGFWKSSVTVFVSNVPIGMPFTEIVVAEFVTLNSGVNGWEIWLVSARAEMVKAVFVKETPPRLPLPRPDSVYVIGVERAV